MVSHGERGRRERFSLQKEHAFQRAVRLERIRVVLCVRLHAVSFPDSVVFGRSVRRHHDVLVPHRSFGGAGRRLSRFPPVPLAAGHRTTSEAGDGGCVRPVGAGVRRGGHGAAAFLGLAGCFHDPAVAVLGGSRAGRCRCGRRAVPSESADFVRASGDVPVSRGEQYSRRAGVLRADVLAERGCVSLGRFVLFPRVRIASVLVEEP